MSAPRQFTPRVAAPYQAVPPPQGFYEPRQGSPLYQGQGRAPAPFVPGGYRGNARIPRHLRPEAPLKAVDLTHRVVIPPPKEFVCDPDCICERKVRYLICTGCGFLEDSGKTRTRRKCRVHPKHLTYTDLAECPACQGDLEEH